jgi:DNA-binding transcriptional ArsR family regulator
MKAYNHPEMRDVPLHAVMQALSDPCRIAIVQELLTANGRALACNEVQLDVCKATRSHHFDVLRAAGIIYTEVDGTKCMTSLRRAELNKRFPGLLKLLTTACRPGQDQEISGKRCKTPAPRM